MNVPAPCRPFAKLHLLHSTMRRVRGLSRCPAPPPALVRASSPPPTKGLCCCLPACCRFSPTSLLPACLLALSRRRCLPAQLHTAGAPGKRRPAPVSRVRSPPAPPLPPLAFSTFPPRPAPHHQPCTPCCAPAAGITAAVRLHRPPRGGSGGAVTALSDSGGVHLQTATRLAAQGVPGGVAEGREPQRTLQTVDGSGGGALRAGPPTRCPPPPRAQIEELTARTCSLWTHGALWTARTSYVEHATEAACAPSNMTR